jgi:cell division protein FtsN
MSTTPIQRGPVATEPAMPLAKQPVPASVAQPRQEHVNAVTQHLENAANALRTPQERADAQSQRETQRRADEQRQTEQRRNEQIAAAAKQQQSINRQRETQLQVGDMAVIDLDKLNPEQHTVPIRRAIQALHQTGGHKATGRISDIRNDPSGRTLVVQAPHATYEVPEALATRADLWDDD